MNKVNDLEVKASDLLQSNGVIWVEGPSDRIYIKKWLEILHDDDFKEGEHYQFLYYGGRLLSHYELGGDESVDGLISILTTNRNAAIIIDSDKKYRSEKINDTKKRIENEFKLKDMFCWITDGKEIENYLTADTINRTYGCNKKKDVERYELFPEYIKGIVPGFKGQKVAEAKKIASNITNDDFRFNLKRRINDLYNTIEKWNRS